MILSVTSSGEVTLYAFVYADLQEANYRLTEG